MSKNNILELRGKRFIQASKGDTTFGISMNGKEVVTTEKLQRLVSKLQDIRTFWATEERFFPGILISVHYNKNVAKSNRISKLFKGRNSNDAVVGAKFNESKTKHIITYYVDDNDLVKSINFMNETATVLNQEFKGTMNQEVFDDITKINGVDFDKYDIKKSPFKEVIADVSYIENFEVEKAAKQHQQSIITLYNTKTNTKQLLNQLGIDVLSSRILDNQTVFLDKNQLELLFEKAPYLVSMATVDMSELVPDDFIDDDDDDDNVILHIPRPSIEPTIGVIDTLFDERVYFNSWVEYHDMVSPDIPRDINKDYKHGTAVSSIIVDGPRLNPWLDDGCGRFRVRHFGVATGSQFSSFTITKQIKEIIADNKDIKVWNISLGSNQEINDNFISAEASILDKIQYENDVIFVISGTNKNNPEVNKIGSPADSINSLVVNAVTNSGESTKYSRSGLALSFFSKPDVSYYGGSVEQYIRVCEPLGEGNVAGTSFAAPWIARKLSYLIDVMGIRRELAKALIIDSARGWKDRPIPEEIALYGHGIVPIKIDDILTTEEDEIRFLISDVSEKWNTYTYDFPVPLKDDRYPYFARATMCYFPKCNRAQGVDYTSTELNLQFGRMLDNGKIKAINWDNQNSEEAPGSSADFIFEEEARANFRKWDNVKYISETLKERAIPRISYSNKNWGMSIKTVNRLDPNDGVGIRFGVVVTLKEMKGVNRIDEFIHNCHLNGWLVNQIEVQSRVDIHQKVNEEIEFE